MVSITPGPGPGTGNRVNLTSTYKIPSSQLVLLVSHGDIIFYEPRLVYRARSNRKALSYLRLIPVYPQF